MTIRPATEDDAQSIADLVRSLSHFYQEDASAPLPEWFLSTIQPESFTSRMNDPDDLHLVYADSGAVKGYIAVKNATRLYHLFVDENLHGQGIATRLWLAVRSRQPESRHYTVRSSLYAVPVYRKFGFFESGCLGFRDGIGFQPMTCDLHIDC